jgi:hypothetical protein
LELTEKYGVENKLYKGINRADLANFLIKQAELKKYVAIYRK